MRRITTRQAVVLFLACLMLGGLASALVRTVWGEQGGCRADVYVLGDSISMAYGPALEAALAEHGLSYARKDGNGRSSRDVALHVRRMLRDPDWRPERVLLNAGMHDVRREDRGPCLVSLADYRLHLTDAVTLLQREGIRVVWVTTTPVNEAMRCARRPNAPAWNRDIDAYNAAARAVMAAHGVPIVDLHRFTRERAAAGTPTWTDGTHYLPDVAEAQGRFVAAALIL
jgi:lysophospholipase L1-like esterase